jgi:hypothetical protein
MVGLISRINTGYSNLCTVANSLDPWVAKGIQMLPYVDISFLHYGCYCNLPAFPRGGVRQPSFCIKNQLLRFFCSGERGGESLPFFPSPIHMNFSWISNYLIFLKWEDSNILSMYRLLCFFKE